MNSSVTLVSEISLIRSCLFSTNDNSKWRGPSNMGVFISKTIPLVYTEYKGEVPTPLPPCPRSCGGVGDLIKKRRLYTRSTDQFMYIKLFQQINCIRTLRVNKSHRSKETKSGV